MIKKITKTRNHTAIMSFTKCLSMSMSLSSTVDLYIVFFEINITYIFKFHIDGASKDSIHRGKSRHTPFNISILLALSHRSRPIKYGFRSNLNLLVSKPTRYFKTYLCVRVCVTYTCIFRVRYIYIYIYGIIIYHCKRS